MQWLEPCQNIYRDQEKRAQGDIDAGGISTDAFAKSTKDSEYASGFRICVKPDDEEKFLRGRMDKVDLLILLVNEAVVQDENYAKLKDFDPASDGRLGNLEDDG